MAMPKGTSSWHCRVRPCSGRPGGGFRWCAAGVRYRAPARKGPSSAAHWRSMIVLASAIWVERGLAQDVPVAGKDFYLTDLDAPVADEAAAVLVQLGAPASVGGVDARCHAAAGMSAVLV